MFLSDCRLALNAMLSLGLITGLSAFSPLHGADIAAEKASPQFAAQQSSSQQSSSQKSSSQQIPALPEGKAIVLGHSYTLESKILGQTRPLHVYLPPGYADSKQDYPVLVLLDGGVGQDFPHIAGIASLAADWRYIREFIVVGVETLDRYQELVHPTEVAEEKQRLPTAGGSAIFRKFLRSELKPWITKHLRSSGEDVLMGESAAGLFVTETLLREPQLFSGYIAISPSLWWNRESLSREAATLMQKNGFAAQRVFLSLANEGGEMESGVDRVVAALKTQAPKTLQWTYVPMKHEEHATIYHPAALEAVRWMFKAPPAAAK